MESLHPPRCSFSKRYQLIFGLLLCLLSLARADAQDRSEEVSTLLSFKSASYDSSSNENLEYWNTWNGSDENACAWAGVRCTDNYTVSELDFSSWGLPHISSFGILSNLTDLSQLDLSSNGLTYIAQDINMLTGLTRLDVSRNYISGPLLQNISSFQSLRFLSLQRNYFGGQIPSLSGFAHLQFLNLAENSFSGPLPKDLGELRSLVSLDLSNNSLSGSIPALPNLDNLVYLNLDDNNFTGFEEPWSVSEINNLRHFSVSFNQLEGTIPSNLTNLLGLVVLDLSHNQLSSKIPFGFSNVYKSYLFFDLSTNNLSGTLPADILQNSSFVSMNLSHNLLTGSIPFDALQFGTMFPISLDLSHNNLTGQIPSNIFQLIGQLQYFGLQNNMLSGDIVDALVEGNEVPLELRLQNNLFTGDLSRFAVPINASFTAIMDLSNNYLQWSTSEVNPDPITTTLSLLFGWGPLRVGILTEFRVGGNNFSGTALPTTCFVNQSLANRYPLKVLDLSNSHLHGEILDVVFNSSCVPFLNVLNLSNNHIIGQLPESIISIPNLEVLDVSHNNLTGSLPQIPSNGSLSNPGFFEENDKLCGFPLPPCVPNPEDSVPRWELLSIILGSTNVDLGSALVVGLVAILRWRLSHKGNQQDADLMTTLMERDATTVMSLQELQKATNNFAPGSQIGEGGFGAVYLGTLNDGTKVAIKRSKREGSRKDKKQFLNEVRILAQVNHRNLVKLLGCCMENNIACLIFEFVPNGTLQARLQDHIVGVDRLSWKQRLNIAVQTANALNYLHSAATIPIYHRDVKSANILLDEDLNAKVADFGISKLAPIKDTHVSTAGMGTIGYVDPEYWVSFHLSDKSDVYSFGVVLLELISAKLAVDMERGTEDISLVIFANPRITRGDLQELIDPSLTGTYNDPSGQGRESILTVGKLAMKCLNMQSRARPKMNEVLKELESLWLQLNATDMRLDSVNEHDEEDPLGDRIVPFSDSFSNINSNSLTMQNGDSGIQMSR